jgi:hypothetical protein
MKSGVLCLMMLLPACSWLEPDYEPVTYKYALTWYCISPEGCERTQEVARIDRATEIDLIVTFTSTQDPSFEEEGKQLFVETLPRECAWLYYLSFFGHDLERSRYCHNVGGFELELAIPNEDPATHSQWVVSGRDLRFL